MVKINEIREQFEETKEENLGAVISLYAEDERTGVKKLVQKYKKAYDTYFKENDRLEKLAFYEKQYSEYDYIAGIDEVGRGPLAGPVVTCAVILPKEIRIRHIDDSKKLSEKMREELYEEILDKAIAVSLGSVTHKRIDEINILQAVYEAMRESVNNLKTTPQLLLNDAVTIPGIKIPQVPIIKGDAKSMSIAAASIVAKVSRDRLMAEYDKLYPGYGFASNKGYGSEAHIKALKEMGASPIHRKSFIKNILPDSSF